MARTIKTVDELFDEPYLTKTDIARLLGISRQAAEKVYFFADKVDDEELTFRIYPTKVRQTTVLSVASITKAQLRTKLKH